MDFNFEQEVKGLNQWFKFKLDPERQRTQKELGKTWIMEEVAQLLNIDGDILSFILEIFYLWGFY